MKLKPLLAIMAIALSATAAGATDAGDAPKFTIAPTGTAQFDGALYISPDKKAFPDGVAIPEVRLGAKMSYGKWSAKIEAGLAYNKVGLKDLYVQYNFDDRNLLKGGSFIHHYGLNGAYGANFKSSTEEPLCNALFNEVRQIGIMYEHSDSRFMATFSAHAEPSATTVILTPPDYTREGYGFRTRTAYRPIHSDGKILQIGISGAFSTPTRHTDGSGEDTHDAFTFKGNFPTRVVRQTALSATVHDAMNLWKFSPEILLSYDRLALEAQYFFQQVNRRKNLPHYNPWGAYALVRCLIFGDRQYAYSEVNGCLVPPSKGTLEAVALYNFSDLNSGSAKIYGGKANTVGLTLNYYVNRYMTARLNYSYTHTFNHSTPGPRTLNSIVARFQVVF